MSFGAFSDEEVQKMVNHTLECMPKESLDEQVKKYGSMEKYKEHLVSGFANEQAVADLSPGRLPFFYLSTVPNSAALKIRCAVDSVQIQCDSCREALFCRKRAYIFQSGSFDISSLFEGV